MIADMTQELPFAEQVEEVKAKISQWIREDYPTAKFAWYEPPYVQERLRLIIKCYGKEHHIALPLMAANYTQEAIDYFRRGVRGAIERRRRR